MDPLQDTNTRNTTSNKARTRPGRKATIEQAAATFARSLTEAAAELEALEVLAEYNRLRRRWALDRAELPGDGYNQYPETPGDDFA